MQGTTTGRVVLVTMYVLAFVALMGGFWLTTRPGYQIVGAIIAVWNIGNIIALARVSDFVWTGR